MAKSLRSKSKRAFRSKKRESGIYAAAEAARLSRLHAKLAAVKDADRPVPISPDAAEEIPQEDQPRDATSNIIEDGERMSPDVPVQLDEKLMLVSTHGPRGSRREEWRKSKGMDPIPKCRGMNRQGSLAARRKAGRPSRRRCPSAPETRGVLRLPSDES